MKVSGKLFLLQLILYARSYNGTPILSTKKQLLGTLYDNDAVYIAALLYDDEPNKIMKSRLETDLELRMFWSFVNGYNDGQQDFQFFVNAAVVKL
jgi:hypothetical protein